MARLTTHAAALWVVSVALLCLPSPGRTANSGKKDELNAYSFFPPPTPARTTERWVKIWYNKAGWWVAWRADNVNLHRGKILLLDMEGRIACKGKGEIEPPQAISGLKTLNKIESKKNAIYFQAPLGIAGRTIRFKSTAKALKFSFVLDGHRNASDVIVGREGKSPKKMPFILKTPDLPSRGKKKE